MYPCTICDTQYSKASSEVCLLIKRLSLFFSETVLYIGNHITLRFHESPFSNDLIMWFEVKINEFVNDILSDDSYSSLVATKSHVEIFFSTFIILSSITPSCISSPRLASLPFIELIYRSSVISFIDSPVTFFVFRIFLMICNNVPLPLPPPPIKIKTLPNNLLTSLFVINV